MSLCLSRVPDTASHGHLVKRDFTDRLSKFGTPCQNLADTLSIAVWTGCQNCVDTSSN